MRGCVWGWRLNDAQRETASLSRYAAVHVLRPERADTGGACQLPVFRQGDGDYSERCGADGPVCALPCGVRSRSDDDEGRAAQCAVRMDSEDVGDARGTGEGCGMTMESHQANHSGMRRLRQGRATGDMCKHFSQCVFSHFCVVLNLTTQPITLRQAEIPAQTQIRVSRNAALAMHDFIDAAGRHVNCFGERILADSEGA